MKSILQHKLATLISVAFFSFALAASASASTVTRSFSTTTPAAGTSLTVSLAVDQIAPDTLYAIEESVPTGWTVTNPGTATLGIDNVLRWFVMPGTSTIQQYTVSVPANASGTGTFAGNYAFDSLIMMPILGQTTVTVQSTPLPAFDIVSSAGPNGIITPLGTTSVVAGSNQTYMITPNANYQVADVIIDNISIGATTTYTFTNVSAPHTISATFSQIPVVIPSSVSRSFSSSTPTAGTPLTVSLAVTVTPTDTYYVIEESVPTGWSVTNPGSGTVGIDNIIRWFTTPATSSILQYVVAIPATSSGIQTFGGNYAFDSIPLGTTTLGQTSVNVLPAAIVTYDIVSSAGPNGSISPLGTTTVNAGGSQTYAITPNLGYQVADVLVDGISVSATTTYTFTNVAAPHTISATFSLIPVLTTINVNPNVSTTTVGTSTAFTAATLDQNNAPIAATLTWTSSNPAVGSISSTTGIFTALSVGTTTITASSGNITGSALVNVIADNIPPTTPNNLSAAAVSSAQINLSWSPSTDNIAVIGYKIFRNSTSTVYATTTLTTFADTGLTPSTAYTYTIAAYDLAGNISPQSTSSTATTLPSGGGGGGGGGTPPVTLVIASNSPMTLLPTQEGRLERITDDGINAKLVVPIGAINSTTTFAITIVQPDGNQLPDGKGNVYLVGGIAFNITAIDFQGNPVTSFNLPLSITLTLPMPNDRPNLGVYYFDAANQVWKLVPGADIGTDPDRASFTINHLTLFGVVRVPGLASTIKSDKKAKDDLKKQVLGIKIYPNGTLIKAKNHRIYVIKNKMRVQIANLKELLKYKNKPIIGVSDEELNNYPLARNIADGSLIRGSDKKIFVIKNGKKVQIRNLAELRKYWNQKVISVDQNTLAAY